MVPKRKSTFLRKGDRVKSIAKGWGTVLENATDPIAVRVQWDLGGTDTAARHAVSTESELTASERHELAGDRSRSAAIARKKLAAAIARMDAAALEAQSIMDRTGRSRDVPPEVSKRHADALAEVKRLKAELGIKWDDDASEKRAKAGLVLPSVELSRALGVKPGESLGPAEPNAKIAEHTRSVQAVRDAGEPRNKIIAASLVGLLAGHGFKRDPWPDITARMLRWPLGQGARTNGSQTVQWFGPHSDKGLDIDENLELELIDSRDGTLIRKIRIVPGRGREANAIAKLLGKSADTSNSPESHAGYASE